MSGEVFFSTRANTKRGRGEVVAEVGREGERENRSSDAVWPLFFDTLTIECDKDGTTEKDQNEKLARQRASVL